MKESEKNIVAKQLGKFLRSVLAKNQILTFFTVITSLHSNFTYPGQNVKFLSDNYSGDQSYSEIKTFNKKMYKNSSLSSPPGFLLEEHSLQTQSADAWQGH